MATTTSRTRPPAPFESAGRNGNGRTASSHVAPPKRRVRLPELAVGILVTVLFALGAVLWHLNATTKVPALAVSTEVRRGEVIESSDLRVIYLASDDMVARLTAADSTSVVGRVALVDLAPGTIVTSALVADAAALGEGEGVVGLALEPGQYPSLGLAPGDRVNVVATAEGVAAAEGGPEVVAHGATVFEVEDLASSRKLVSILTAEADAEAVAAAASSGGLRLVLVAP